ncbi:MAG: hypothetical protein [Bacteriophage sp.]|nr:MAG: hypothetical protein [Bacteriophage sp.]
MKALTTEQLLPLVKNGMPEDNRPFYDWRSCIGSMSTCLIVNVNGGSLYVPVLDSDVKACTTGEFIYLDDYINALAGGAE